MFNSVINLDAYQRYSNTNVILNASDYTIIDSRRTIAARYSLRVGVEQANGNYRYSTLVYYVEFYTNGSGSVI